MIWSAFLHLWKFFVYQLLQWNVRQHHVLLHSPGRPVLVWKCWIICIWIECMWLRFVSHVNSSGWSPWDRWSTGTSHRIDFLKLNAQPHYGYTHMYDWCNWCCHRYESPDAVGDHHETGDPPEQITRLIFWNSMLSHTMVTHICMTDAISVVTGTNHRIDFQKLNAPGCDTLGVCTIVLHTFFTSCACFA